MGRDVFAELYKSHFLPFRGFLFKRYWWEYIFLIGFVFAKHVGGNVGRCCRDCVPPVDPKQPPRKDNLPPVFFFMMLFLFFRPKIQNNLRAKTTFHQFSFSWCLFSTPKIDPCHFTFIGFNGVKMLLKIPSKKLLMWCSC